MRPEMFRTNLKMHAIDNTANAPWHSLPTQRNALAYDMSRPAGTSYYHKPRGSWKLENICALTSAGAKRVPVITGEVVYVKFEVCEPLLLSPFIFGAGHEKNGGQRKAGLPGEREEEARRPER